MAVAWGAIEKWLLGTSAALLFWVGLPEAMSVLTRVRNLAESGPALKFLTGKSLRLLLDPF
jgi:hypothetical protein